MISDEEIIKGFKKNNTKHLNYLYNTYRGEFVNWAVGRFSIDNEDAADVFSDAVIDVYQNIVNDKYVKMSQASLKSYLFEIGKNKLLNISAKSKISEKHLGIIARQESRSYESAYEKNIKSEMVSNVRMMLGMIDEKCRKVLSMFYFYNVSMSLIAEKLGMKSEDVAKNKKLKCMKKLQEVVLNKFDKSDFF
jgi:RNA polymerase sigma-70 factor (ECF subfamily)